MIISVLFFFLKEHGDPRDLHYSPTRHFPDLGRAGAAAAPGERPPGSFGSEAAPPQAPPPSRPQKLFMIPSTWADRKSTRLNSSHANISYAVFCLKKKKNNRTLYTLLNLISSP